MKKVLTASLLALLLVLSVFCAASADISESDWSVESATKVTISSGDNPAVYFACTFVNNSDVPLSPGLGNAELFDQSGNSLYTGFVTCTPSVVMPGEKAYFSLTVFNSFLSDPDAEVADYQFTFEPYESSFYTYDFNSAPCTLDTDSADVFDGYPITVQVANNGSEPIDDFYVIAVFTNLQNGEPLFVTDAKYVYNRLPAGSSIEVLCHIPEPVMHLIQRDAPDYTLEAFVAAPN